MGAGGVGSGSGPAWQTTGPGAHLLSMQEKVKGFHCKVQGWLYILKHLKPHNLSTSNLSKSEEERLITKENAFHWVH